MKKKIYPMPKKNTPTYAKFKNLWNVKVCVSIELDPVMKDIIQFLNMVMDMIMLSVMMVTTMMMTMRMTTMIMEQFCLTYSLTTPDARREGFELRSSRQQVHPLNC